MRILVIGSGGREHALTWKISQSPHVTQLWAAPGNPGMTGEILTNGKKVEGVPIAADNLADLLAFALEKVPDLTVVGPDNPLALGIVDLFQDRGFKIWGANKRAALFESSKVFSQQFLERHGIPTARSGIFAVSEAEAARQFARNLGGRCAIKADGLALGKGVLIATSVPEAVEGIEQMLVGKKFGLASEQIVIQELLEGTEVSLHALCDGRVAKLFPASQDHKRIGEGDTGLNTGGMGAYSPAPFLTAAQMEEIERDILTPWLAGCLAEGIDFRGLLYPGVMLTASGPRVLEFNARFGDPEAQVYLSRLNNDLVELLEASVAGNLGKVELSWSNEAAVCVVMASSGYPGSVQSGKVIRGLEEAAKLEGVKVFQAGTRLDQEKLVTAGGRVLSVTARAANLREAMERAYRGVEKIQFDGAQFRRDIGRKGLAVET